jgi:small subunit ribosomal protein S16
MLRIRLSRTGKKRQPSYRVVVAEKEAKRDGRVVERIGYYNPLPNPAQFQIDEARALHWLSVGAQPSDAVRVLLNQQGTFGRLERLHAGETLDALVAEYRGPEAQPAPAAEAPTLVERAGDAVGGVVAAVTAPVAAVYERVEEAAGAVVERVQEAVEAVIGSDEEE